MFNRKITKIMIPLAVAILSLPSLSLASFDSVFVDITTGACIINSDSTEVRVLLKFDLPDQLSNADIFFAELVVPLTSYIPDSSALRVLNHPLLVSWNEDVVWNDLGDSLTGNIIGQDGTHFGTAEEGEQTAYFNITHIVEAWKEEIISNNGIILFCSSDELPYFRYNRNNDAPFATAKIYYDH